MCTLLTVSRDLYTSHVMGRIIADSKVNNDGWSLVLTNEIGVASVLRTMDLAMIFAALARTGWQRMFLHSRMATQGKAVVQNSHAWEMNGVFYMHNGCIWSENARSLPVDSQIIGQWLRYGGLDGALDKLLNESFANVFLIDNNRNEYIVTRSNAGSLHTDGHGNYSTYPVEKISLSVDVGLEFHYLIPRLQLAAG